MGLEIDNMTNQQLKAELVKRDSKTNGNRVELVKRLKREIRRDEAEKVLDAKEKDDDLHSNKDEDESDVNQSQCHSGLSDDSEDESVRTNIRKSKSNVLFTFRDVTKYTRSL